MKFAKHGRSIAIVAIVAALAWTSAEVLGRSNQQDVTSRLAAIEATQKEILKQLQELTGLLKGPRAAPPATPPAPAPLPAAMNIADAASHGRADAKLTILEFSDFQCPFCARHSRETLAQLEREYVDTGKVRYVFRHFPIESIHPQAFKAAMAGECARQQGKFWEMHKQLFANQKALADSDLLNYAKSVGLNSADFQRCVTGPVAAKIRQDLDEGARAGVTGTPMFFLGTVGPDGKLKVLRRMNGAASLAQFKTNIDQLLSAATTTP